MEGIFHLLGRLISGGSEKRPIGVTVYPTYSQLYVNFINPMTNRGMEVVSYNCVEAVAFGKVHEGQSETTYKFKLKPRELKKLMRGGLGIDPTRVYKLAFTPENPETLYIAISPVKEK